MPDGSIVEAFFQCGSIAPITRIFHEKLRPFTDNRLFSANPLISVSPPNVSTGSVYFDYFNENNIKQFTWILQARTDLTAGCIDIDLARREFLPKRYDDHKHDFAHNIPIKDALEHGITVWLKATDNITGLVLCLQLPLSKDDVKKMWDAAIAGTKTITFSFHVTMQKLGAV